MSNKTSNRVSAVEQQLRDQMIKQQQKLASAAATKRNILGITPDPSSMRPDGQEIVVVSYVKAYTGDQLPRAESDRPHAYLKVRGVFPTEAAARDWVKKHMETVDDEFEFHMYQMGAWMPVPFPAEFGALNPDAKFEYTDREVGPLLTTQREQQRRAAAETQRRAKVASELSRQQLLKQGVRVDTDENSPLNPLNQLHAALVEATKKPNGALSDADKYAPLVETLAQAIQQVKVSATNDDRAAAVNKLGEELSAAQKLVGDNSGGNATLAPLLKLYVDRINVKKWVYRQAP